MSAALAARAGYAGAVMGDAAVLGIDAGGSSSRWLLLDLGGHVLGRGRGGPMSGHVLDAAGRTENLARLREILTEARSAALGRRVVQVVAGVTGLQAASEAARLFTHEAARLLELDAARVTFESDIALAYHGAFAPGAGVLVYAGTGAVAYHLCANGAALRAGGHGYLIDDAGGGYWIGREGLKAVLREADRLGHPPDTPLARELYCDLGSRAWPEIFAVVYGGGRSRVAALAPAVARAAAAGDEVAAAILEAAGLELARLARVLLLRLAATLPVVFAGGVTRLGARVRDALRAGLPPEVPLVVSETEPVETAARLALERARASADATSP